MIDSFEETPTMQLKFVMRDTGERDAITGDFIILKILQQKWKKKFRVVGSPMEYCETEEWRDVTCEEEE